MDNPHDIFDVVCSNGARRAQHGDTIITDRTIRTRYVEPIAKTLAEYRELANVRAQLDVCAWLLDNPSLFG